MKVHQNSEIIELNSKKSVSLYDFFKRIIDIIGASIGLFITAPIFIIIIGFYLIGSNRGPIFFKQIRVGKNGENFYIYKFRSMIVNAQQKLEVNKELYQKYVMNNYKLEPHEDPRITDFGRFIRKTSLDEIPQFINVLKGEMSLVGPRPVVVEELNEYKHKKDEFLSVKPGITGYWQVCGRSSVGYPERVDLELHYVYNKSLYFDIKILVLTVFQVITRKGAY